MKRVGNFFGLSLLLLFAACSHPEQDSVTLSQLAKPPKWSVQDALVSRNLNLAQQPLIVVDPGHGAYDKGAEYYRCTEKQLNLKAALFLKDHLQAMGYRVQLTRNKDIFVGLAERARMANQLESNIFVSIHFNSAPSTKAQGIEVFYHHKAGDYRLPHSQKLASEVLASTLRNTGARNRGVKKGNFCVIRETKMPAILIEGGFMTNPDEIRKLKDKNYMSQLTLGIAQGIDRYFQSDPKVSRNQ